MGFCFDGFAVDPILGRRGPFRNKTKFLKRKFALCSGSCLPCRRFHRRARTRTCSSPKRATGAFYRGHNLYHITCRAAICWGLRFLIRLNVFLYSLACLCSLVGFCFLFWLVLLAFFLCFAFRFRNLLILR